MPVDHNLIRMFRELGLGVALSIAVFVAFFFLLKWVLNQSSIQLKQMAEERLLWGEQLRQLNDQVRINMMTNKAFFDSVTEAHKFQREEHREMIKALGRINGYKDG